jgi:hypothetical protein
MKRADGFSMVETMISAVVLTVAVVGASGYRYYAALDAKKAVKRAEAARVGLLLCDSWRGVGGDETYDPMAHLGTEMPLGVPDVNDASFEAFDYLSYSAMAPEGFTELGRYKVASSQGDYYPVLSWQDVSSDLRALSVAVYWPPRDAGGNDPYLKVQGFKEFKLTTYVPR